MIAITGIGIVAPTGIGKQAVVRTLRAGSAVFSSASDAGFDLPAVHAVGVVRDFRPKDFIPPMVARRMSRFSQLAVASAVEAVAESGLSVNDETRTRIAVAVGTGIASTGSTDTFFEGLLSEGPEGTNPMIFPETVQNIAASHIGIHFSIRGPNITFSHADISSELSIAYCCGLLESGQVDAAIVSGADEMSSSLLVGYASLGLLSERMQPFDRSRGGFVAGEGGATMVLERLEDAQRRGARIHGLLAAVGFGSAPVFGPDYDTGWSSMSRSMQTAMQNSGIAQPGCVIASANGTDLDGFEADAVAGVFGRGSVPVTALRAYHGYYPSDGMLRIASAVLCMNEGIVPVIPGLGSPCSDAVDYVTAGSRETGLDSVLVNSFSPGGGAASVLARKIA